MARASNAIQNCFFFVISVALYYHDKVYSDKGSHFRRGGEGGLKECGLAVRQATHGATRNGENERIGKEDVHSS